ncbi:MAG: response regulator [Chitinophagales bacterium]|nr:response regulator [Chitinophagales bacterium]
MKVLLVDDSHPFNVLSGFVIKDTGIDCTVHEALNGKQAIELMKNNYVPDIIFLDLNMPVMDGFDFLQQITTEPIGSVQPNIYILTSSHRDEDEKRATSFEIVKGFFEKPLTEIMMNMIVNAIHNVSSDTPPNILKRA